MAELTVAKETILELKKETIKRENFTHINKMLEGERIILREKETKSKKNLLEYEEKLNAVQAENENLQNKLTLAESSNNGSRDSAVEKLNQKLKTYKEILGNLELYRKEYISVELDYD